MDYLCVVQDDERRLEIMEAFHTIKEEIFLISQESEIKEMFE